MPTFHLHLVTDRSATPNLTAAIAAALAGGVDWVQLREKTAPARDQYDLALELNQLCTATGAGLLVNDRADVAVAVGARGVHLTRRSLPPAAVRGQLPPDGLIGLSVHTVAEAVAAARAGVDYLTFGSVFPTRSHPGGQAQGLEALAQVARAVPVPVLAIGGITADNAAAVLDTGCAGIALISAILAEADPRAAAARLRAVLDQHPGRPCHAFAPRPL